MAKKIQNIEVPSAKVKPVDGGGLPAVKAAEVAAVEMQQMNPGPIPAPGILPAADERLFALYVARVSTIDRYHFPITDKGLAASYRRALDEARGALSVFENRERE